MDETKTYEKRGEHVIRAFPDETLLVPVMAGAADLDAIFVLNDTAKRVWELVDGRRTLGEIASAIVSEYRVSNEQAHEDVREFVERLREGGLVAEVGSP